MSKRGYPQRDLREHEESEDPKCELYLFSLKFPALRVFSFCIIFEIKDRVEPEDHR